MCPECPKSFFNLVLILFPLELHYRDRVPLYTYAIPGSLPERVASLCPLQHIATLPSKKNNIYLTSQLLRDVSANVSFMYLEAGILGAAIQETLCNSSIKQGNYVIFQTLAFIL